MPLEPEYVPKVYRPITLDIFLNAFDASRIKASQQDLIAIFNFLCPSHKDVIDFWSLWDLLLPNLTEKGKEITDYLWNTLNPQKDPEVNLSKMKNRFFGKFDPDVQKRKRQEREVENEFIRNLDTYCQVGMTGVGKISKQEFDGFLKCWYFVSENERDFLMRVVECFRLSNFINEYGINSRGNMEASQSSKRDWGSRGNMQSLTSYNTRDLEQSKGSAWGNFTEGKEEIKYSRRGRSTYGRERFKRQ